MRRREFISIFGGAVAGWALTARARAEQLPRVGVLWNFQPGDQEGQARLAAFTQGLREHGWNGGSNIQIDSRWVAEETDRARLAEELVALTPDVLLAAASPSIAALLRVTRSIPIVFASVIDPVGAGYVKSLARPGGNATGFTAFEYSISAKWLELLKQIAPQVVRVAVLRDPTLAAGIGQFAVIQSAASSLNVELSVIDSRDAAEIERDVDEFASKPGGGLIVTASSSAIIHRQLIVSLATRYRLPNVYAYRYYTSVGGLASYGPDPSDEYKRAAGYVDRILKGEKPGNLPVQAPTKYELVVNLKTAKAMGLQVPSTMVAAADDVIE
jgi:putative tryptophan/tyrosine transport system substrate-binding protein